VGGIFGFNNNHYPEISISPKKETQKSAKGSTASNKKSEGFTDEGRAAMKERAKELKAEARAKKHRAAGESDVGL
jgi:Zn-dependent M16 (insulinase) family peptidase